MIFEEEKVIFIHVPKTGGNSIQSALVEFSDDEIVLLHSKHDGFDRFGIKNKKYRSLHKHSTLSDYKNQIGECILEYRIFVTLRNPFDRLTSFYFSPHRGISKLDLNGFRKFVIKIPPLQYYLLTEDPGLNGVILKNTTFLRFENLTSDFGKLLSALSLSGIQLPPRNASKKLPYVECFDGELRKWVEHHHRFEIALGSYSF